MLDSLTQGCYSVNSLKSMLNDWNSFVAFCQDRHVSPLPASVTATRLFLSTESKKKKFPSIKRFALTIGTIHKIHDLKDPANHRQIKFLLNELRASKSEDVKSASAFTKAYLDKLHTLLSPSILLKDMRDLAIYHVMFECALKRSELRQLSFEDISYASSLAHIQVQDKVYELSSQASTTLERWLSHNTTGIPFCRIDKHENLYDSRLDDSSIYRVFRRASDLLCLSEDQRLSGQSSRVGAAQELASQGYRLKDIQDFGRWLSPVMPAQYLGRTGKSSAEKLKFISIKPWD